VVAIGAVGAQLVVLGIVAVIRVHGEVPERRLGVGEAEGDGLAVLAALAAVVAGILEHQESSGVDLIRTEGADDARCG
jgi:hypothetical protein